MTNLKKIIEGWERPRNAKGRFMADPNKKDSKEISKIWRDNYFAENPWIKHLTYARSRCYRNGRFINLTNEQMKILWFRDKAYKLEKPSIDRINNDKGYFFENCRFIEKSENSARQHRGRKTTPKQRETARKNLSNWWEKRNAKRNN